jgi:hypothetical protein
MVIIKNTSREGSAPFKQFGGRMVNGYLFDFGRFIVVFPSVIWFGPYTIGHLNLTPRGERAE